LQISVGDLAEAARPASFALSALLSAWVFYDARGRADFGAASVWAWALLTLAFAPGALPLYLAARLYTRRDDDKDSVEDSSPSEDDGEGDGVEEPAPLNEGADDDSPPARRRLLPALLYAAAVVCAGAVYFYADYRSFEARVARAERAKLYQRPGEAVAEYRAALRVREDGHTRTLLASELLRAGRAAEALEELRAAARAGDGDEALAFHLGSAHAELGQRAEAAEAFRQFLAGQTCARAADARCDEARARLHSLEGAAR
jgi:tetratricopeptide (TPR) repeat protein